ncbi:ribbon-helix-helix protein copG family (plasmid) [Butyrivibrio proteoclasticus B316]|uniref:Ribbon-helix-helix protein copG family n=1 Tax=Butyrivibrio proteoclasticus (strain ATCC 51982 / DSM 14932 / B316) TaxID=515622 RepID=E0S4B9_BUTPB|nr:ribbon-helix-helix protein, CopG family [Butyrivibrio proteoclasticus]ADL36251.1 ribbon-helix-helix protein copG family [Butyrivibrio proteoclasticus B316]
MSRPKTKDSENLSCRLDKKAMEQLNELCDRIGLTKTKAVEKAIAKFYAEYMETGRV